MPDFVIRAFGRADLPALQRVRQAAFAPVWTSFREIVGEDIYRLGLADSDTEQAALLDGICAPDSDVEVLVAAIEGAIVGFAAVSFDRAKSIGEIGLHAVHPDHAGRGIGTALYRRALDRMREEGMRLATVATGGDPAHAPARRAYAKAGFGPAIPSLWFYRRL